MKKNIESLRFPIGKFQLPEIIDELQIKEWISIIEDFPKKLQQEVQNLNENDLKKQYKPNGWTITQVVHHCADSHMNSFMRFKLALTEDTPVIKPYKEDLWAELADSKDFPIESSLKMLEGIHERWSYLLKNLSETQLEKQFSHPESQELISLKTNIALYAWHCKHHLQHIINAKNNIVNTF